MAVTWTSGPGRIVVREHAPLVLKLFGLPFLGIGLYLGRILVGGAMHGELTAAGWVLLPLLAVAFLVPGLLLTFASGRTVVDAPAHELVSGRDLLVFHGVRRAKVPRDARVQVRHELRRTGGSGHARETGTAHVYCPVELLGGPEPLRIAEFDGKDGDRAFLLATEVATLLGVPLDDRRRKPGEPLEEAGTGDAA